MTAADFCRYVNDELLHPDGGEVIPHGFPRQISVETARKWLHELGFSVKQKKKGIYVDGHDHEDVIQYREQFLDKVKQLEDSHRPPPKASDEVESEQETRYREECILENKKELVFIS